MENTESREINRWLSTQARIPDGINPLFRLVWSTDQKELRRGIFELRDENGKFIREEKGTKRVSKYPWDPNVWVLEMWRPPSEVDCEELPEAAKMGSYESLYMFKNRLGQPLPLRLEPVQFMIKCITRPSASKQRIKSAIQEEMDNKEKIADKKDKDFIEDNSSSPIGSLLYFGEAVTVPKNYEVDSPNRRKKDVAAIIQPR